MDEGTLNDLLECSVCLERLDTSSKVLPCQHTFCKKCLQDIVDRHKELRCPECRILVNIKVDELPPNVLLMRILEGMRNAAPKKTPRSRGGASQQQQQQLSSAPAAVSVSVQSQQELRISNKHPQAHLGGQIHQSYAKAVYDYNPKEAGDLSFKRGDIIILRKKIDNNWFQGECAGKQGVFPASYVQIITPVPSHIPQCKALFDFRMTNDEEEGCLTFTKGEIINVIRRVDENWAEGKLNGRIGIFPLAFVELNNLARSLMKLSTNAQPGPSRVAPPTPTTDESTPLIPTDHTRNVIPQHIVPTSDTSSSNVSSSNSSSTTTTPNVSSSNTSSSSSTAPSSPASPPPRNQPLPPRNVQINKNATPQRSPNNPTASGATAQTTPSNHHSSSSSSTHHHHHHHSHHNKEKRHSFTGLSVGHQNSTSHRHSAEIFTSSDTAQVGVNVSTSSTSSERSGGRRSGESQLPAHYVALYPYKPQKADELELKKGGIYLVTERCQDGWFKGTSNRTQKCGVFPGNYVVLARGVASLAQLNKDQSNDGKVSVSRNGKGTHQRLPSQSNPPELPPRSISPATAAANTISCSWHGSGGAGQDGGSQASPLGRSTSAIMSSLLAPHLTTLTCSSTANSTNVAVKNAEKPKEQRKEKGVSLMRRLASIKRSKSPPPSTYSMDNPVFEDSTVSPPIVASSTIVASPSHPVHVRSGSCPSQLLQIQPNESSHRLIYGSGGSTSQRHKYKERPSVLAYNNARTIENQAATSANSSPDVHRHKKSNSLDAGSRKTSSQSVRERFRCIAPYPPNSEYELELQVGDVIYVNKKREDGWYKGTQQRTGRTGLFPASFVESF